jgi:hypothetical protein
MKHKGVKCRRVLNDRSNRETEQQQEQEQEQEQLACINLVEVGTSEKTSNLFCGFTNVARWRVASQEHSRFHLRLCILSTGWNTCCLGQPGRGSSLINGHGAAMWQIEAVDDRFYHAGRPAAAPMAV